MPKRKLYSCRHCNFVTEEKTQDWQHRKQHIRPEKLLSCDSCQFVTEYKHHQEYHQNNHKGYKPFKCDSCDYQCVNKSMLNSHLKSHSPVYLYHCSECKYATKYAHSLKMHMRKYDHHPVGDHPDDDHSVDVFEGGDQPDVLDLRVKHKRTPPRPTTGGRPDTPPPEESK